MRLIEAGADESAGGASLETRAASVLPRRVGVLTFHRCINYGSYWQARCLALGLSGMGFGAALLDHRSRRIDRSEWRCALRPQGRGDTPSRDRRSYAAKTRRFMAAFDRLPLSARFDLDDPSGLDGYDAIVVGSDEVWNLRHPWYGGSPLFYGDSLPAPRLISYAASFGNHDAAAGLDAVWRDRLRRFHAISVRDDNSAAIVRAGLGREPALVLDPCLQFPPSPQPCADQPPEPYIAVYGHGFPGWYGQAVRDAAAALGCRLVSIGYRNDWADEQRIEAGPEDFAALIAGAAAVATNFFHGCVFALLNRKPFACVSSEYRSNKVRDLTALIGAQRHLLHEADAEAGGRVRALLAAPLDAGIFRRIEALRQSSAAYLAAALS